MVIERAELSQNTVRLPACPAGDIAAADEKDALNFLFAAINPVGQIDNETIRPLFHLLPRPRCAQRAPD